MKDPEASFFGLAQTAADVLVGGSAVGPEGACLCLPALSSVELGAFSVLWAGAAEPRLQEFVALEFAHFPNGCVVTRVQICVSRLAWDLTPHG